MRRHLSHKMKARVQRQWQETARLRGAKVKQAALKAQSKPSGKAGPARSVGGVKE